MRGIQGFAEGFSGGLDQGLGIMRSFRDERRRDEAFGLQKRQALQGMEIQRSQEGRAAESHSENMENARWTKENIRPLTLEQMNLSIDRYKQDIETGGVELAMKRFAQEHQLEDWEFDRELKTHANARADRSEARADRAQTFGEYIGREQLKLSQRAQGRMEEAQDFQQAAALLPVYTSLVERQLPIPPAMQRVLQNSPFGITNMVENAEASAHFAPILGMAAKGDFSFMQNPDMRASAYALSRSVGMRIAREKAMEAGSARVVDFVTIPGSRGGIGIKVTAFDPKSGTYKTVVHGVRADHLAEQMQLNSRTGEALRNHPSYRHMAGHAGIGTFQAPEVRKAAEEKWYKLQKVHADTAENVLDVNDPRRRKAAEWLARYPDPDTYANEAMQAASATRAARGPDLSRTDANRVFATVARYTGIMGHDEAMTRANGALRIMGQLKGRNVTQDLPGIAAKARELGAKYSDPASMVRLYYEISNDPKLKQELGQALRGGQGARNPSSGARGVPFKSSEEARHVAASLFPGAAFTSFIRTPERNKQVGGQDDSHHLNRRGYTGVDVKPIPGMTPAQYVQRWRDAGYEVIDTVFKPHGTGPHWHVAVRKLLGR